MTTATFSTPRLSDDELASLKLLAQPNAFDPVSRTHLEKLSRLDLIEPCPTGVCLTGRGREILVKRK